MKVDFKCECGYKWTATIKQEKDTGCFNVPDQCPKCHGQNIEEAGEPAPDMLAIYDELVPKYGEEKAYDMAKKVVDDYNAAKKGAV